MGLVGNEAVDVLAKQALSSWDVDEVVSMSKAEAEAKIWTVMVEKCQEQWNRDTKERHLFQVQRKVGEGRTAGRDRREEAIFTRLRVRHSQLNKTLHVIGKYPTGKCEYCQETETVEHVLIQREHYWRE